MLPCYLRTLELFKCDIQGCIRGSRVGIGCYYIRISSFRRFSSTMCDIQAHAVYQEVVNIMVDIETYEKNS